MSAYSNGRLSSDVVFPAVHRLEKMIDDLADDRADWVRRQVAVTNRPTDVKADWPTLAIEQRRAIIQPRRAPGVRGRTRFRARVGECLRMVTSSE